MPKKEKLNLENLKIQSFVTTLNKPGMSKVGGAVADDDVLCGVTLCPPCTSPEGGTHCPTNDFACFTDRTYCCPKEVDGEVIAINIR